MVSIRLAQAIIWNRDLALYMPCHFSAADPKGHGCTGRGPKEKLFKQPPAAAKSARPQSAAIWTAVTVVPLSSRAASSFQIRTSGSEPKSTYGSNLAATSARAASKISTTGAPFGASTARCSAHWPTKFLHSAPARPLASRTATTAHWPCLAAMCRAVSPLLVLPCA